MVAQRKLELNKANLEKAATLMGVDIEGLFKKMPKLMGWADSKVLAILGFEFE